MKHTLLRFLYKSYWAILMRAWHLPRSKKESSTANKAFSIGIVTYINRYEQFFKPLVVHLTALFPDTELVIALNGHHDQTKQADYLKAANAFLSKFSNVKVIGFEKAQSLSKLWNLLILNSTRDKIFIFNDDVKISTKFRKNLENIGIARAEVALINRSWSHFLISKSVVEKVGWFDERFPSLGNEDEDYEARLTIKKIPLPTYKMRHIYNVVYTNDDYSYGEKFDVINKKYGKGNKEFFDSKWDLSPVPADGFTFVEILNGYVKLKEGMETPAFHTLIPHKN